ncbi:MAG TPA: hypothetical protein VMM37_07305 [Bacteroidota bacterium]|nr:hypothetical protein [Bacteroidota bacterium]
MRRQAYLFILAGVVLTSLSPAQTKTGRDSTIVFQPIDQNLVAQSGYTPLLNAWGFDLLISNNGFGAGVFLRHEYTDEIAGFINFAISDVKDENEVEYYNWWTGQSTVPNKVNRLLYMPLVAGIQYRLFKDDIVDNFRPYVTAGVGPTMVFVAPYATPQVVDLGGGSSTVQYNQIDFFSSLKYGRFKYTVGGYIGAGAYFGLDKGTLSGINVRYYFSPFPAGIEVMTNSAMKTFGGFYITLNFGSLY